MNIVITRDVISIAEKYINEQLKSTIQNKLLLGVDTNYRTNIYDAIDLANKKPKQLNKLTDTIGEKTIQITGDFEVTETVTLTLTLYMWRNKDNYETIGLRIHEDSYKKIAKECGGKIAIECGNQLAAFRPVFTVWYGGFGDQKIPPALEIGSRNPIKYPINIGPGSSKRLKLHGTDYTKAADIIKHFNIEDETSEIAFF